MIEKTRAQRVASMGAVLLTAVMSILFILYGVGMIGLIKAFNDKNEKDCTFYSAVSVVNMAFFIATIYLILQIIK